MKKLDLKTGMLVQLRNGSVYLIINDYIVNMEAWVKLRAFDENLLVSDEDMNKFDIMKVSTVLEDSDLIPEYWTEETLNRNLLWERGVDNKDLNYWKDNAEDGYMNTPLCVLRYITALENKIEQSENFINNFKV